jgi:hypothetical protein
MTLPSHSPGPSLTQEHSLSQPYLATIHVPALPKYSPCTCPSLTQSQSLSQPHLSTAPVPPPPPNLSQSHPRTALSQHSLTRSLARPLPSTALSQALTCPKSTSQAHNTNPSPAREQPLSKPQPNTAPIPAPPKHRLYLDPTQGQPPSQPQPSTAPTPAPPKQSHYLDPQPQTALIPAPPIHSNIPRLIQVTIPALS